MMAERQLLARVVFQTFASHGWDNQKRINYCLAVGLPTGVADLQGVRPLRQAQRLVEDEVQPKVISVG
jgi:hypothetical protein